MPDGAGFVCQLLIGNELLHGQDVVFIIILLQQFRLAEGDLVGLLFMLQDGLQHFTGFRVDQLLVGQFGQVSQGHAAALPGILGRDGIAIHVQNALGVVQGIGGFFQFIKFFQSNIIAKILSYIKNYFSDKRISSISTNYLIFQS